MNEVINVIRISEINEAHLSNLLLQGKDFVDKLKSSTKHYVIFTLVNVPFCGDTFMMFLLDDPDDEQIKDLIETEVAIKMQSILN